MGLAVGGEVGVFAQLREFRQKLRIVGQCAAEGVRSAVFEQHFAIGKPERNAVDLRAGDFLSVFRTDGNGNFRAFVRIGERQIGGKFGRTAQGEERKVWRCLCGKARQEKRRCGDKKSKKEKKHRQELFLLFLFRRFRGFFLFVGSVMFARVCVLRRFGCALFFLRFGGRFRQ